MSSSVSTKLCNKCKQRLPTTEFYRNGWSKDGRPRLRSVCKPCHRDNVGRWARENRDKVRERHRRYRLENRAKLRAYKKEWDRKHIKGNLPDRVDKAKFMAVLRAYKKEHDLTWAQLAELAGQAPTYFKNLEASYPGPTKERAEFILRRLYGLPTQLSDYEQKNLRKTVIYMPDGSTYTRM